MVEMIYTKPLEHEQEIKLRDIRDCHPNNMAEPHWLPPQ
jgi:hypothetical protein